MKYLRALKNSSAYKTILNDIKSDKLSHAYLITSNDEEIIKSFFSLFGCLVFCKDNACLECDYCRKVINHNHADIQHIIPETNKQLKVKDIEELIDSSQLSAIESTKRKLYFIYNAERMNVSAQNKLLKTLEEPPAGVTIIIGTINEASILDTVKSRSRKLYIDFLDSDSIYNELVTEYGDSEKIKIAARASGGNIQIAERLINDNVFIEDYNDVFKLFTELNSSRDIITYINKPFFSKDRIADTLSIMEMVMHDALNLQYGNNIWASHKKNELSIIVSKYTSRAIIMVMDIINQCREKLLSNCNATNVADSMLFNILEVKYKCRKL